MSETVTANNGVQLPLSDLPISFEYSAGIIATQTTVYRGITYVQTFTNDGTNITSFTPFEAQS
jgi:hypothetical protein